MHLKKLATGGILSVGVLASTLLAAGPAQANVAPADARDCTTAGYGAPGAMSFTFHLSKDPCGYKVRAWVTCFAYTATGNEITAVGATSKANCNVFGGVGGPAGWDTYVAGTWVRHYL